MGVSDIAGSGNIVIDPWSLVWNCKAANHGDCYKSMVKSIMATSLSYEPGMFLKVDNDLNFEHVRTCHFAVSLEESFELDEIIGFSAIPYYVFMDCATPMESQGTTLFHHVWLDCFGLGHETPKRTGPGISMNILDEIYRTWDCDTESFFLSRRMPHIVYMYMSCTKKHLVPYLTNLTILHHNILM